MLTIHVIPTKAGLWRVVYMTPERERRWSEAYEKWWKEKGHRLAISPEMWVL